MSIHTNYLTDVLDTTRFISRIRTAKKKLKEIKFDAFAVTGNSGTLMGGALSAAMKKKLILVRKPNENSHSSYEVEGDDEVKSFVFLDDQISTGTTRDRVVEKMAKWAPKAVFVGCYQYNDSRWKYDDDYPKPKKRKPRAKTATAKARK